jgi:integrase
MARKKTSYPGVFYRETKRIGAPGIEKVFYVVFKKDGKVYEEKVGRQYADDMTPARASTIRGERVEGKCLSRKEMRKEREAQQAAEQSRWTFDRLWQEYQVRNPALKGFVTDSNRYQKHIQTLFGGKEPNSLSTFDIDRLRIKLLKDHSPGTVKNVMELLRRLVNFGVKKQLCEGTKFVIEMPKVNNIKTEDLSPEQLARLLEEIEKDTNIQAANFMKMALFTGMRRGELFKLQWQDIDFERGFIHIIDPKGGPNQKIPLSGAAREILDSHPRSDDSPFVFPGRDGKRRVDIKKQVNRIKERAGIPKDFRALHGLRHVYASMLASSGQVDLYTLQKLLTHKSPAMTQRYAHLRDETLKNASELAGNLVAKATEAGKENPNLKLAR